MEMPSPRFAQDRPRARTAARARMSGTPLAADPLRSGRGIFELQSFSALRSPMPKATMGACLQPISSLRESPRAAPKPGDGHQIQEEFQRLCQSSPVPKVVMDRLQPQKTMPPPPPPPPGQYHVDVRPSVPTEEASRPRVSGLDTASPTPAAPGASFSTVPAASPLAPAPHQRQVGAGGLPGGGPQQQPGARPPAPPKPSAKGPGDEGKGPGGEATAKPPPKQRASAVVTLKAWHLKRLGKKADTGAPSPPHSPPHSPHSPSA